MKAKKNVLTEILLRTILTASALVLVYVAGQMLEGPVFKLFAAFGVYPVLEYQHNAYQFLPSAVFQIAWISVYIMLANVLADILLQEDDCTRRTNALILMPLIILPLFNNAIKACLGYEAGYAAQYLYINLLFVYAMTCLCLIRPVTRFTWFALSLILTWFFIASKIALAALVIY